MPDEPILDNPILAAMVAEEVRPICDRLAGALLRLGTLLTASRPDSRDYEALLLDGFDPAGPRVIAGTGTGNRAPATDHQMLAMLILARRLSEQADDDRAVDPSTGLPVEPAVHTGITSRGLITGLAVNVQF